jgi:hypothetical protein
MDGTFVLVKAATGYALDTSNLTGTLDVAGASVKVPGSKRVWKDIGLSVVAEPAGIRIQSLRMHESDIENKHRKIDVSGLLALDHMKPQKLTLALAAKDWLVHGGDKLGMADAPRATADFDIGVEVDLKSPIMQVDATIHSLALRSPDRQDRGHQPELASVSGDIIYVDRAHAGKLPYSPVPVAVPRKRKPIDIRVHIPKPIRLNQTPFDVMAHGDINIKVRDDGVTTRGALTMDSGSLYLFGYNHDLIQGSLVFDDAHPQGWLALTFDRKLPDVAMRELARSGSGAQVKFAGSPTRPKTQLQGTAGAALFEVMAMYNAGRPVYVTRPGLPASSTVQAPRGDQLFMLTFMASNLPHLLFLDRVAAYADPYAARGSYGQIRNVEAERVSANKHSRIRAVVRPPTPGRSKAELQWDRLFVHDDRKAIGVGVRAGDRAGGGVGLFVEWSSSD